MSENLPTQFPKPPELHPLRSIQAKVWQVVGSILIGGGLSVMGWGGWLFYQQQAELHNPPAPILEAPVIEDLETPTSQSGPTKIKPTAIAQKVSGDVLTVEPGNTPTLTPAPPQEITPVRESTPEGEIDSQNEFPIEETVIPHVL